jgi:hypothetical protein
MGEADYPPGARPELRSGPAPGDALSVKVPCAEPKKADRSGRLTLAIEGRRRPGSGVIWTAVAALVLASAAVVPAGGDDVVSLRARAADAYYSLDYDEAETLYRQVLAVAPDDVRAHRGLATVQWLRVAFARGTVTVDEFLGGRSRPTLDLPPPPAELARLFHEHADRAVAFAERAARARPHDPEALFEFGASMGLVAAWTATVDGRLLGSLGPARTAYDAHERVLALAPGRADAGLVAGMYRYLVSTLPLPGRWLAYLAGFGGGRETGLRLVEGAASFPSESREEARLALVLLYNRERRYDDALRVLATLRGAFPRNRLFWLESGATALRAGRPDEAVSLLEDGLRRSASDSRPRATGEASLWQLALGNALVARRDTARASASFRRALDPSARDWVRARAHLGLGRAADLEGRRTDAVAEYREAARAAGPARDAATSEAARVLLAGSGR